MTNGFEVLPMLRFERPVILSDEDSVNLEKIYSYTKRVYGRNVLNRRRDELSVSVLSRVALGHACRKASQDSLLAKQPETESVSALLNSIQDVSDSVLDIQAGDYYIPKRKANFSRAFMPVSIQLKTTSNDIGSAPVITELTRMSSVSDIHLPDIEHLTLFRIHRSHYTLDLLRTIEPFLPNRVALGPIETRFVPLAPGRR